MSNTPFDLSKPRVQLPGDNRLLSEFAADLGERVSQADIFRRGTSVFTVNLQFDKLTKISAETLRTWAEQYVTCFKIHKSYDTEMVVSYRRTMTGSDAEGVLVSPQFLEKLRPIERFNRVRLPVIRPDGRLELLPTGYDSESQTFTVDSVPIVANLPMRDAREIIDALLAEFGFADNGRSKAVAVSGMLSVFGGGLLSRKSLRPCIIVVGNAEGTGKTLLVKSATVPVLGYVPTSCRPSDDAEMRKTLLTAVIEAKPVLFFDNIKGRLDSEPLEGFLTAQEWNGRVLGVSETFTGENLATVFITGNGFTVSPDIRRRSLFCELFSEAERPEDRQFKQRLEVQDLLDRRTDILSALMSFVRDWDEAMRPKPSRVSSSFPEWSETIGGIVEHAGYGCPVQPAKIQINADVDGADMRTMLNIVIEGTERKVVTFDRLREIAIENDLFGECLNFGNQESERTRIAKLASLFRRYDRRLIGDCRFSLDGTGRNRRYIVEKVKP